MIIVFLCFVGKCVYIMGVVGGFGCVIVCWMVEQGVCVFLIDIVEVVVFDVFVQEFNVGYVMLVVFVVIQDVCDEVCWQVLFVQVIDVMGVLLVFVNNVGVGLIGLFV